MKSFVFNLQKVLRLRETQLELEEARFKQQVAAVAELDRTRAQLEAAGVRAEAEVRKLPYMEGRDVAALGQFRLGVQRQERDLAVRRAERQRTLEKQQLVMLEARRRCRLLERLRERQQAEWQADCDRELEETASESFLAGWARGQRQADAP
ncbi:MAG TPA: hypothetical protein VG456_07365 [Candidatus Sulfopaludibacter sp.]|jgi:hypothetical protein|nr:hypothetical protein [Candidatus Sulfopaludibacter sp.]